MTVNLVLLVAGAIVIYGGALLLWLRPSPSPMWIWAPIPITTVGLVLVLLGAALG